MYKQTKPFSVNVTVATALILGLSIASGGFIEYFVGAQHETSSDIQIQQHQNILENILPNSSSTFSSSHSSTSTSSTATRQLPLPLSPRSPSKTSSSDKKQTKHFNDQHFVANWHQQLQKEIQSFENQRFVNDNHYDAQQKVTNDIQQDHNEQQHDLHDQQHHEQIQEQQHQTEEAIRDELHKSTTPINQQTGQNKFVEDIKKQVDILPNDHMSSSSQSSSSSKQSSYGAVDGVAGISFPALTSIPATNFTCENKPYTLGMYADLETNCQVYHTCFQGRRESFLCSTGTIFNQAIMSCDFWYSVNCSSSKDYYDKNVEFGKMTNAWSNNNKNTFSKSTIIGGTESGYRRPPTIYRPPVKSPPPPKPTTSTTTQAPTSTTAQTQTTTTTQASTQASTTTTQAPTTITQAPTTITQGPTTMAPTTQTPTTIAPTTQTPTTTKATVTTTTTTLATTIILKSSTTTTPKPTTTATDTTKMLILTTTTEPPSTKITTIKPPTITEPQTTVPPPYSLVPPPNSFLTKPPLHRVENKVVGSNVKGGSFSQMSSVIQGTKGLSPGRRIHHNLQSQFDRVYKLSPTVLVSGQNVGIDRTSTKNSLTSSNQQASNQLSDSFQHAASDSMFIHQKPTNSDLVEQRLALANDNNIKTHSSFNNDELTEGWRLYLADKAKFAPSLQQQASESIKQTIRPLLSRVDTRDNEVHSNTAK